MRQPRHGHTVMMLITGMLLLSAAAQAQISWQHSDLAGVWVTSLAVGFGVPLYAGTYTNGVYRSTDDGMHWTPANSGMTTADIGSLAVNTGILFAGADNGTVYRSSDHGDTWTQTLLGVNDDVHALLVLSDNTLLAGVNNEGIFRSTDDGAHWAQTTVTAVNVHALAVSRTGRVFAGTSGGVFHSSNSGVEWTRYNTGLTTTAVHAIAVGSDGAVFAGTTHGVFRLADLTQSWVEASAGITSTFIYALACNPVGSVYAGTAGGGVFGSINANGTWWTENANLTNLVVYALAVDGGPGYLYAGTRDGLFRSSRSTVGVSEPAGAAAVGCALGQNYPNPFMSSTTIPCTLDRPGTVRLSVRDVLGRELRRIVHTERRAGLQSIPFDADGLPSGIYQCVLEAGTETRMRMMTIAR